MKNWKMVVGATAAALLLVLAVVVFRGGWLSSRDVAQGGMGAGGGAAPAIASAVVPKSGEAAVLPSPPEAADTDALPAWMTGAARGGATGGDASSLDEATAKARAVRSERMQAAVQKLQALQAKGATIDPMEAERALSDLEKANGSNVLQGIRLDVLRENLRVAARMQKAAEELQALQRGGGNGAAQQAEIGRKIAEVQALQRQLRMDFQTNLPAPAPATRP